MTLITNLWANPSLSQRGGVNGVVTLKANAWWSIPLTPGDYVFAISSQGLSALPIYAENPNMQLANGNSQLSNPRQAIKFTLPADRTTVAIQLMVNSGTTAQVSRPLLVRQTEWELLKTLLGDDLPYFDGDLMPLT